ncbi:MAG: hypothetical protein R3C01_12270 [Planctomycetaceae bacterium]
MSGGNACPTIFNRLMDVLLEVSLCAWRHPLYVAVSIEEGMGAAVFQFEADVDTGRTPPARSTIAGRSFYTLRLTGSRVVGGGSSNEPPYGC